MLSEIENWNLFSTISSITCVGSSRQVEQRYNTANFSTHPEIENTDALPVTMNTNAEICCVGAMLCFSYTAFSVNLKIFEWLDRVYHPASLPLRAHGTVNSTQSINHFKFSVFDFWMSASLSNFEKYESWHMCVEIDSCVNNWIEKDEMLVQMDEPLKVIWSETSL